MHKVEPFVISLFKRGKEKRVKENNIIVKKVNLCESSIKKKKYIKKIM